MKKGISLVILIITIIVLTILASIMILNMEHLLVNTDKAMLQTDIAQIETLMNTYKIRNNGDIKLVSTEFDVTGLSASELQQFEGENIVNSKIQLYVVNLKEIDGESSNFGTSELGSKDRYLYSLTTGKVYYEQGLEADGTTYYYIKDGEV